MTDSETSQVWREAYKHNFQTLAGIKKIKRAAAAFNANIDAVCKIDGEKLSVLAQKFSLSIADLGDTNTTINAPRDVMRGIIKCFIKGIAEEWLCFNQQIYEWFRENIGYDHLQMGGQGGIVGNALAVLGVQNVYVHTASHPQIQAQQFLNFDNLLAINSAGELQKAAAINREADTPLVHWIIEFSAGDALTLNGEKYVCPKSNRFIATYDPANLQLQINEAFVRQIDSQGYDFMMLSGFHNLTAASNGLQRITETIPLLQHWRQLNPRAVMHLELASTQDKIIRLAILQKIAPLALSVGLNEREALDALEVIDNEYFQQIKDKSLSSDLLIEIVLKIKKFCAVPRIQLHMFGLYITLQDQNFQISPERNKQGMMLAATVAATKAGWGKIDETDKLLLAKNIPVAEHSLQELSRLATYLNCPTLLLTGIGHWQNYNVIAVPTIIIPNPLTLVGMGDTISSVSAVGAL